jgi:hypothetical protein
MSFGEKFREAYGQGEQYRVFDLEEQNRLQSVVPDFLLELWKTDGWAGYRNGLLWTVDPQDFAPVVSAWKLPVKPGLVVARTAFGLIYMLKEFVTEQGVKGISIVGLNPHTGDYTVVGPTARRFLTESLAQPDYIKSVLWEPQAKRAAADVGPLAWDEMYGFEPALALGGSGKPETVRRYNVFNHHLLLSQLVEAKSRKL